MDLVASMPAFVLAVLLISASPGPAPAYGAASTRSPGRCWWRSAYASP